MSSLSNNEKVLVKSKDLDAAVFTSMTLNIGASNSNDIAATNTNELDENDNYYCDQDEENEEYYDEYDCNYDDDLNYDNDDENDNENDLYLNNPEHFEYESLPIESIDNIVEKKCQKVLSCLKLDDPLDSIYILKKFGWNCEKICDEFKKDKQVFLNAYFSDDNNNNSKTIVKDKLRLTSYINIFSEGNNLNIFKDLKIIPDYQSAKSSSKRADYCEVICIQNLLEIK